jgi:hypothetical protein
MRAAVRRPDASVAKSHQELDEADWAFWRSQTPDERLAAAFQVNTERASSDKNRGARSAIEP